MTNQTSIKPRYAEVAPIVPLPTNGKQTYTYHLPKDAAVTPELFSRVKIPLGRRHVTGVVVALHNKPVKYPTKPISKLTSVQLTAYQVTLAHWIARTMHGGLGYTLRLFLPPAVTKKMAVSAPLPVSPATAVTPLHWGVIDRDRNRRWQTMAPLIACALAQHQQVLVVVPEKWLVPVVAAHLADQYQASVATLTSDLGAAAQTAVWQNVQSGRTRIVVGTQKAVFLPYQQLGFIIVEEESFTTHKLWDAYPRLDGREVARQLAAIYRAPLVWSARFPSLALYHALQTNEVLTLLNRPLPLKPSIVATTNDDRKHSWVLPRQALVLLSSWLNAGERVLLVQHRHDAIIRRELHRRFDRYLQKVAAGTRTLDPMAKLLVSTTAIFTLLGDQNVDRVMLLYPEKLLGYPDYRTDEETQLLVARLSALLPAHRQPVLVTKNERLMTEKFIGTVAELYDPQLVERQRLGYPPFTDVVRLTIQAKTAAQALKRAQTIREQIDEMAGKDIKVRGPFPGLERSPKQPQFHLLLTGELAHLIPLYEHAAIQVADLAPARIL